MNYDEHEDILAGKQAHRSFSEQRFGLSSAKFLLLIGISFAALFYLWVLVFGNNSLLVLIDLEEHQNFLSEDIEHLKNENAALQKQYFELKELDADAQLTQQSEQL